MRSLRFHIPIAPVSQQASGALKAGLKDKIRSEILSTDFYLSGEVRLHLDWMVHERVRYETDTAPDIDNILKPIIDALTGPKGVIIDDCQVQRVNCGWLDGLDGEQSFDIELEYTEDELIPSRELQFIQFENGLCFPFEKDLPGEELRMFVSHLVKCLAARDQIRDLTGSYETSLYIMPTQRFFHRSRVNGFDVTNYRDIVGIDPPSTPSG